MSKIKPMVGTRIPPEWMDQIEAICRESGKSPSDILREALGEYLGKTDVEAIASMSKRLATLERQYQKLIKLM